MKRNTLHSMAATLGVLAWLTTAALTAAPVISNVQVSQRAGTKLVDVYYDLTDADGHSQTVWINVSSDGGLTWTIPSSSISGAAGSGVTPGTGKHLVWNAGQDWNGQFVANCRVRIFANDGTTPIPPSGMVYIPAGQFQMGDNFNEVGSSALPVHNVQVDAFFMDINDVSGQLWITVRAWANANGYTDLNSGSYAALNHPVVSMTWYEGVKWCNARSERDGLTPVYYTDATLSQIYREGGLNITNACVNWNANGYRLPTEAEWEKAARGGMLGKRYPWGDTFTGVEANWANTVGTTTPVGQYPANGYGLYDMAGNVWQFCWDFYDSAFYVQPGANDNPRGPAGLGSLRVCRGGSWIDPTLTTACAVRNNNQWNIPQSRTGFRCVRGH